MIWIQTSAENLANTKHFFPWAASGYSSSCPAPPEIKRQDGNFIYQFMATMSNVLRKFFYAYMTGTTQRYSKLLLLRPRHHIHPRVNFSREMFLLCTIWARKIGIRSSMKLRGSFLKRASGPVSLLRAAKKPPI